MRGGGCDDHILSDGRLHLSPFPPAPKEQVRSIPLLWGIYGTLVNAMKLFQ